MCQGHGDATASREEVARLLGRRGFLRTAAAGAVVAGATGGLATDAVAVDAPTGGSGHHRVPPGRISIQLYTLRNQLAIDFEGTLAALAEIGYRRVETAGFVGRTVTEFKAALDAVGIWASSNHVGIPQPFDAAAWSTSLANAQVLESRYVVHPAFGINFGTGVVVRDRATWAAFAHDLNEAGRMARAGRAPARLPQPQLGVLPAHRRPVTDRVRRADRGDRPASRALRAGSLLGDPGGPRPGGPVRRLRGRVRQYHVKDMNQAGSFEDPGQGLLDFPRIFRTHQVEEYIVERDDAGSPPRTPADALVTARVGYEFLRAVRF